MTFKIKDMYKNFSEYWELKKEMFKKLGVDKATVKTIWDDCANLIMGKFIDKA